MSLHELVLGGLPIDGVDSHLTDEGWLLRVKAAAHGTTFGSAEAVMSVVDAMGADGGQARIERWGNAVSTIQLQILGVDATALALGEAAVRRVLPDGYGTSVDLLWRPPDGLAPASVRTVLTGVLGSPSSGTEWDRDELRLTRTYPLELTHEPHVRSEHLTVTAALPAASDVTVVDDCSSATGWTASDALDGPITPTVVSGTLRFAHNPWRVLTWRITPPVVLSASTPWLTVDARLTSGYPVAMPSGFSTVGGVGIRMVDAQHLGGGLTRFIFDTAGRSGVLRLLFDRSSPDASPITDTLSIDQIGVSATRPSMGKQIRRTIRVGGTERTPGTLKVSARDGTTPLGLTLVHTCPDDGSDYDPSLQRWAVPGGSVLVDDAAPMGLWRSLDTTLIAAIPPGGLPQDTYQLGAFVRSATTQQVTLRWTVGTLGVSTSWMLARQERIVSMSADAVTWVALGRTTLPATASRRGFTLISIEQIAGAAVSVGGWYALRAGRSAAVTVVNTIEPHLFIEAGEGGGAPGSWMVGDAADGSDAYVPSPSDMKSPGVHTFPAGPVATYLVATGSPNPAGAYEHYRRWVANAADDGLD